MTRVAAACAGFGRDMGADLDLIGRLIDEAREGGVELLVLPEAALGGYLATLDGSAAGFPPALDPYGPELAKVSAMAASMVVTVGFCEDADDQRYNSVAALTGDGLLHVHRKVHQPLAEDAAYSAGDGFAAFDSPVGRLGLMICYDKAFPEAARTLAMDGADIICCSSAWPGSRTGATADLDEDRWRHRFDLHDRARALENQVLWLSANQAGTFGQLRFVGHAKVVGPGGEILADTGLGAGLAIAEVDVPAELASARASMCHLRDRRPDSYGTLS